jgi:hypothetical protein
MATAGALVTDLYGPHSEELASNPDMRDQVRDRAAYVYVTGQYPTHLRSNHMGILRAVTSYFRNPVAMDGRSGSIGISKGVITDLDLEAHPMVVEVKDRIAQGYLIQPSREVVNGKARRSYAKVYMYKRTDDGTVSMITIHTDGAVRNGWD